MQLKTRFYIYIIVILAIIVYSNIFVNNLVYDDLPTVRDNKYIREWKNVKEIFSYNYFSYFYEMSYRPLVTLTYFVDYSISSMGNLKRSYQFVTYGSDDPCEKNKAYSEELQRTERPQ